MSHARLAAREVYQLLKDVAQGERALRLLDETQGALQIEIDGWRLTLLHEGRVLQCCRHCQATDGRQGSLDDWHRSGTDPLAFLSAWEQRQIERRLWG